MQSLANSNYIDIERLNRIRSIYPRVEGMIARMRPSRDTPVIVYGIDGEAKTIFLKD